MSMKAPPETVSIKTTKFGNQNEKVKIYGEPDCCNSGATGAGHESS